MSSSRSTAPPARKRSRRRHAWSGAPGAASARPTDLPGAHRSAARSRPVRWCRRPPRAPSKEAYLQLLAVGLNLVDAVKDISTALHDQAKRALENGDLVPGYALSAGRAERHWHDESAAIAALTGLGLTRDDVVAETMRSPKQVELRAKARGLKVPKEFIVSHPLRRLAGAESKTHALRCPDGARSCGRFPRRSQPSKEGGIMTDQTQSQPRPRSRQR